MDTIEINKKISFDADKVLSIFLSDTEFVDENGYGLDAFFLYDELTTDGKISFLKALEKAIEKELIKLGE